MKISPFNACVLFTSLKHHFTRIKYDHFKYNGKVRLTYDKFLIKKDKHVYDYLAKHYSSEELTGLFISNLIKGNVWVFDYTKEDCQNIYTEYERRRGSLKYVFTNDLEIIMKHKNPFKSKEQYPPIIHDLLNDRICMETFSILQYFLSFDSKFDKSIGENDILWRKIRLISSKLFPFLEFDKTEFKSVLVEGIQYHGRKFS